MARATKKGRPWSYSTGERRRNRVRVFERPDRPGEILLQYAERDVVGELHQVRQSLGAIDRAAARTKADTLAAQFAVAGESGKLAPLTLKALFDIYERSVTPQKGVGKRKHDARCATMFMKEFSADRDPRTLSRREWDRFILGRRRGTINAGGSRAGEPVGDRVIGYDLKHLNAVLNWACTVGDGKGGVLLDRNPLKGLPIPAESNPRRAVVVAEQYQKLRKAARALRPGADLLLLLCHETGHRVGAVRQLRWSDIDLKARRITWRAEHDKMGRQHVTQLSMVACAALRRRRRWHGAIGDTWIFRSRKSDAKPWSRYYVRQIWDRLAKLAKLPTGERYGWHSLRRKFASELKGIPLTDLCALGGWSSPTTILTCYQRPDEATQRRALTTRKTLRAAGLSD